jgi:hypothetical protein
MQQSNMIHGEQFKNDMRSMHEKFYEFSMHVKGDINL